MGKIIKTHCRFGRTTHFDCCFTSGRSHATVCKVEKLTKTESIFRGTEYDGDEKIAGKRDCLSSLRMFMFLDEGYWYLQTNTSRKLRYTAEFI